MKMTRSTKNLRKHKNKLAAHVKLKLKGVLRQVEEASKEVNLVSINKTLLIQSQKELA